MDSCPQCGAAASGGRFCTQCGARLPDAVAPAEPVGTGTTVVAHPPPPVPGGRYPLFADEVEPGAPVSRQIEERIGEHPDPTPHTAPRASARARARARSHATTWEPLPDTPAPRLWPLWLGGLLTFLLVLVLGLWLLLRGPDDDPSPAATDDTASSPTGRAEASGEATGAASDVPSPLGGEPRDVAADASADVPATAPDARDVSGAVVSFAAENMLDGDPSTAWRMPGDGTGATLTFELDEPATITEVGLINGYAKTGRTGDRTFDWYAGNRRVLEVEWLFDDGRSVKQSLELTRDLQTVEVPEVTTETVRLRLLRVSAPGSGPAGRDNTPVSEVSLVGRTG